MTTKPTGAQVEAAKLRIILDRKLGRETPAWVIEVSKQTPNREGSEMNDEPRKYKNGGYTGDDPGITRAFHRTGTGRAYVASTISPRLSRQDILDALTDHGSTFPAADELLDERDDRIRKNAAWRALSDAADSMPEMNGAAYMFYVRTWLHNRAKDAFRGEA